MLPYELHIEILKNTDYETFISYRKVFPEIKFNDVFKFFYKKDIHTWIWAADHGYLDVIKFLHKNHEEPDLTHVTETAAFKGHLEILEWLGGHYYTEHTMNFTAMNGHLEVVKWLHKNNCVCNTSAMDWAAMNGHLEVVKWLYENRKEGCTQYAIKLAAINGHIEVVKWLQDHLVKWVGRWGVLHKLRVKLKATFGSN
jgi:hypothetical protein